jgi:cell division protein FtsL
LVRLRICNKCLYDISKNAGVIIKAAAVLMAVLIAAVVYAVGVVIDAFQMERLLAANNIFCFVISHINIYIKNNITY